jgi:hypothetical protein
MKRSLLTYSLGAAVVLSAGACSSDSTVAAGGVTNAEITTGNQQDAGEDAVNTVAQLGANDDFVGASGNVVSGGGPISAAMVAVNCAGPDGLGWYTCSAVDENGFTVVRQIRFWEGMSLGLWWNPGVTDSVNHFWSADGTVNSVMRPGKVWTIDDTAAATMIVQRTHGALPKHSWSGTADRHEMSSYTVNDVERIFTHTAHDTVSAVVFQMPRAQNPLPLSGSIIRNVATTFTAGMFTRNVTKRFVVTFNGSSIATLNDGSLTCDLDLLTRTVSNCH